MEATAKNGVEQQQNKKKALYGQKYWDTPLDNVCLAFNQRFNSSSYKHT